MRKSEIETYMDAFMEGFYSCYCTMIDLIDDDEAVNSFNEIKRMISEIPPIVPNMAKPKEEPKAELRETTQDSSEKAPVVSKPSKSKDEPKQAKKEPPTHEDYVALFNKGKLPTEVAKELNVSPQTAYNHLYKAKQAGELK